MDVGGYTARGYEGVREAFARQVTPMLGEGSFGHDGAGGRIGLAHPESGTAAAFVANTKKAVG